ncbi:hypothetical protein [Pendulispora albinea]|uniref:Glucose-1-phosphate thymidylyltransferase n=1 Tax=Pendulispora albinea TaxID=2741071 RepID=A0ABZ2LZ38_9BACT
MSIACPEEIAYRLGYIDANAVLRQAETLRNSEYGKYLRQFIEAVRSRPGDGGDELV